jgi:hypothetical protein
MGNFEEYISGIAAGEPITDDALTLLRHAYDEDFAGAVAKTNELTSAISEMRNAHMARENELMAANYTLLTKIPGTFEQIDAVEEVTNNGRPRSFDDLFTPIKKD